MYYHKGSQRIDAELTSCIRTDRSIAKSKGGIRFDDSVQGNSLMERSFTEVRLGVAVSMEAILQHKPATETPPHEYLGQNSRGSHRQPISQVRSMKKSFKSIDLSQRPMPGIATDQQKMNRASPRSVPQIAPNPQSRLNKFMGTEKLTSIPQNLSGGS